MKDFIKETCATLPLPPCLRPNTVTSSSLRVDPALRPTPKEMLAHPWIVRVMKQEVPMERWIREVWGWPKPNRKSKDS
jgi:hypothetical protein